MRYKAYPRTMKTRGRPFIRPHQGQRRNPKKVSESLFDTVSKHATNFLPYLAGGAAGILKSAGPELAKAAGKKAGEYLDKYKKHANYSAGEKIGSALGMNYIGQKVSEM